MAVYEPAEPTVAVTAGGLATPIMTDRLTETTVGVRFLNQQRPVRLAFLPANDAFVWTLPLPGVRDSPIDRFVFDKLKRLRINPSSVCDDATFVRRAFLDLTGRIPTGVEAREFVEADARDKRARLVDDLLQRQEFADWWTMQWADLLRNEEKALDRKGVANFQAWIRQSMNRRYADERIRAADPGVARIDVCQSGLKLLSRHAGSVHAGRVGRSSVSWRATAVRQVPQPSLRSMDAGRLLRLGQRLCPGGLQGFGEQASRRKRQARVQRGTGRLPKARRPGRGPPERGNPSTHGCWPG